MICDYLFECESLERVTYAFRYETIQGGCVFVTILTTMLLTVQVGTFSRENVNLPLLSDRIDSNRVNYLRRFISLGESCSAPARMISPLRLKALRSPQKGGQLRKISTCSDDGESSTYSVDTDGYYTSMHTDSGIPHQIPEKLVEVSRSG